MDSNLQKEVLRIATLVRDTEHIAKGPEHTVHYHDLYWCTDTISSADSMVAHDELPETCFISNYRGQENAMEKPSPLPKVCSKAAQLSYIASHDAATFLSGNFPKFCAQKRNSLVKCTKSPEVSIEEAVFVLSRNDSADSTFKPCQYHAFNFSLPRTRINEVTDMDDLHSYRQLLMVRQPGLQRSGPMSLSKDLGSFEAFDGVEICTGMCLFSEEDLNLCTRDGTIQPGNLATLPVSICEKEIMARLSLTIANTAALYLHTSRPSMTLPLRINIDIPSAQYYSDAFDAFDSGKCGPNDVLEWIAAIKSRRLLLFQAFGKAIEYGLMERGISRARVNITLSCGLKAAGEAIFWKLRASQRSDDWIQELLTALQHDSNEFWVEFMQLLGSGEQRPSTWRQFNTLSYMYEVVKPVLRARSAIHSFPDDKDGFRISEATMSNHTHTGTARSAPPSPPPGRTKQKGYFDPAPLSNSKAAPRILLLAIDDSDENRIYTKAYQALCRLSTSAARSPGSSSIAPPPIISRILTICPSPQVIIGTSKRNTDWSRPSLWRASLRGNGEEVTALRFRSDGDCMETDFDILKRVYDSDLVTQLETWLRT